MNRISSKLIMLLVLVGIFLLPVSPSIDTVKEQSTIRVEKTTVKAEESNIIYNNGTIKDTTAEFTAFITVDTRDTIPYAPPSLNEDDHSISMIVVLSKGTSSNPTDIGIGRKVIRLETTSGNPAQKKSFSWDKLDPDSDYSFSSIIYRTEQGGGNIIKVTNFRTASDPNGFGTSTTTDFKIQGELDLGCSLVPFSIGGCIAEIFYLFFRIAAFIGKLAGWFLDFFVYYSTNSTSYESGFVVKGWAAIRDVANIFFIVALLYIAIKTILSLNVTNNKKLISTIIIVALLINFSLFFTQVIIDGTNILAKVFYNNITVTNQDNSTSATGEKSISVGLISKFNPQKLVTQDVYDQEGGTALFIFITILATFIVLYAAFIFFSVAILFVSRVVSLWISMIFAPIAFASYTLPFDIPGLGHKQWWEELLKNAFLAPIFVFMLYIIVMFAGFLSEIVKFPEGANFMQKVMSVVIPFAILMILLMKAKDLAVKFAGEMGKAISKVGAAVGGMAMAAATGGAALAMRGTIGRAGSAAANSNWAKSWERAGYGGQTFRNVAKAAGKGSFDARGVKIAGKDLSSTGLKVGKAKEGGFEKMKQEKIEKRVKRAKELESGEGTKERRESSALEAQLRVVKAEAATDLAKVEKEISVLREKMQDQKNGGMDTTQTYDELEKAKDKKAVITGSKEYDAQGKVVDIVNPATGEKMKKPGSISDVESRLNAKNDEINAKEIAAANAYAGRIESGFNKTLNYFSSFGQHSGVGANIAADRIRKGVKIEEIKK